MRHADDSDAGSATAMQPEASKPQSTARRQGRAIVADAVSYSQE